MSKFVDSFMQQLSVTWFILVPCYFVGLINSMLALPFFAGSVLFVNWYVFGHPLRIPTLAHVLSDAPFYLKLMTFCYLFWMFLLFVKF